MIPDFRLRPARLNDSAAVFAWRNDPLTRSMSRASAPVTWDDHQRWFAAVIDIPSRRVVIAEGAGARLAVVRFDRMDGGDGAGTVWEVSINLNPAWRGRGLGGAVLRAACDGFQAPGASLSLHAEIRAENAASRRVFEAAGFGALTTEGEILVYRRAP
ncbi:MAG: GNAT family N-acetyltransferase [Thalassobaculaceae bacterium]